MRKLIYLIACTVDGFIARHDGSFDFFPTSGEHLPYLLTEYPETIPGHLREVFAVEAGNKHFDAVLMGRRTYEVGSTMGLTNPYPQLKQFVFSGSMAASPDANVTLISNDPLAAVEQLKHEEGLDIWLCGGGELAGTLLSLIDEIILKVNPVLLGAGIPLFGQTVVSLPLELIESKAFTGGVLINRYRVNVSDRPKV
jgi:dihydrofolate reductase